MQARRPDSADILDLSSSDSEETDSDQPELGSDAALTEEWAKEILAGAGVVSPHEVRVESKTCSGVRLSRLLAITINYEENGEKKARSLMVKLLPRDPCGRLFVAEAQFDIREILFYTTLAPILNRLAVAAFGPKGVLSIPKCIKAKLPDEIGGYSELVLEDVRSEGFEAADFIAGLSIEKARAALNAIARFHALSLCLREREGPLDQRFDFLFPCERAAAGYLRLIQRGLPQLEEFLKRRRDCLDEADAITALIERAPALLGTLLRSVEPSPLSHSDFWNGNLLFRERHGETECIALDWQMVSLGRPMDDVALFILSSLTPEMRRAKQESLIEEYGDRLESDCAKLGVATLGAMVRKGLKADWPRAALRALILCAGSVDVALGQSRAGDRLLMAVRDLHAQGVLDLQPDTVV